MKNVFKVFGIIAIVAVIGFSMTACEEEEQLGEDEGVITIQSVSSLWIHNYSKYEVNVTVKDSNYKKESKTIPFDKSFTFNSLTPPVTVTYSPKSKVEPTRIIEGIVFNNK